MHTPHDALLTIGEAAARTGLTVKAVRFYADEGIVPETARSPAGYRLYDSTATARLDLVRSLRDLGIDLPTVRALLRRDADLGAVAAAHVESLDAQIRLLRLRRAVLRTVAHRTPTEREITLMTDLARLSAQERQRIIDDYHDAVFGGLDMDEEFVAHQRSVRVDLPDDPSPAQVDAWVELAGLVGNPAFRDRVRRMSTAHARARAEGTYRRPDRDDTALAERVAAEAGAARTAGLDPADAAARPVVDGLAAAALGTRPDTPQERRRLADELAVFVDARVERYWHLVGVINGWAPMESHTPSWEWFLAGLRAHAR
ncbi:MerR family transcriptional regulator [Streptomonospora mangrovi]